MFSYDFEAVQMTQRYGANKNPKAICSENYRYSAGTMLTGASSKTGMMLLMTFLYDKVIKRLMCNINVKALYNHELSFPSAPLTQV